MRRTLIGTKVALMLALCGCYSVPDNARPMTAADVDHAELAAEAWRLEGFPDPSGCDQCVRIVYPASREQIEKLCLRCSCGDHDGCDVERWGCADACFTTVASGFGPFTRRVPLAVVSETQPRGSWVHELGHCWERCLGMPNAHRLPRPEHEDAFNRWLRRIGLAGTRLGCKPAGVK